MIITFACPSIYSIVLNELGRAIKNVPSGICGQRRLRSDCASAQSDQGLHCSLTETLNEEQISGWNFVRAQDDLHLRILRTFKGNFSLEEAQIYKRIAKLLISYR